jgi:hypothetical protein
VLKVKPGFVDRELARRLEGGSEIVWGGTLPEEVFTEYGGVTLADTSSGVCEFAGFYIDLVCIDRDIAMRKLFENVRVTFWIDNKEVVQILSTFRLGGIHSLRKLRLAFGVFELLDRWNCLGEFLYIPTSENPADAPTRLNPTGPLRGLRLDPVVFRAVEERFGAFDLDALSDQACRQTSMRGGLVPYISRHIDADSIGENVFCYSLGDYGHVYANPPQVLLRSVVQHLRQTRARGVLVCGARDEPVPAYLRADGMGWESRMELGAGASQLRTPGGWETFRRGGAMVAVGFDFRMAEGSGVGERAPKRRRVLEG